jgi:hypothetical protein
VGLLRRLRRVWLLVRLLLLVFRLRGHILGAARMMQRRVEHGRSGGGQRPRRRELKRRRGAAERRMSGPTNRPQRPRAAQPPRIVHSQSIKGPSPMAHSQ